jgi:hypothetical protein
MRNHFHMNLKWIARQPGIGGWKYLSNLLAEEPSHPEQAALGI